jgi:hypothetical protein
MAQNMSFQNNNEKYHPNMQYPEVRAHLNTSSVSSSKHTQPQTSKWLLYNKDGHINC